MSVLFWLFGLGAAAIAFPILFHLIRRQPQGQTDFSSLMFLRPTPPRISRRSRIENWLLLLLRSLAILAVAFAFMRPFVPDSARLLESATVNRRIAILIDTSASMQRSGVWEQVVKQTEQYLDSLEPTDQVAVFGFDSKVETLVPFSADGEAPEAKAIVDRIKSIQPSWQEANLATALSSVARQLLVTNEENAEEAGLANLQIMLISDSQSPADWNQIQTFQWPESVKLDLLQIGSLQPDNASLYVIQSEDEPVGLQDKLRITNDLQSKVAGFSVRWSPRSSEVDPILESSTGSSLEIQVAPGIGQSIAIPEGFGQGAGSYQLVGDQESFGNQFFAVNAQARETPLYFLTDDPLEDPNQMLFYFQHALPETKLQQFRLEHFSANESEWVQSLTAAEEKGNPCNTIFVNRNLTESEVESLHDYVTNGGRCVIVISNPDVNRVTASFAGITEIQLWEPTTTGEDYLLFGEMNFQHSLLHPFREAGFNDFTKVRFWSVINCTLDTSEHDHSSLWRPVDIIARFDNGMPAIWERRRSNQTRGSVIGLSFGWQPEHSQLALSSKFVPLVQQLISRETTSAVKPSYWAGQEISLPAFEGQVISNVYRLEKSGRVEIPMIDHETKIPLPNSPTEFASTIIADQPGIYAALSDDGEQYKFAVNVNPVEYSEDRLTDEDFSTVGISTGQHSSLRKQKEIDRLKKDIELEDGQKIWKWLIATAMVLLVAEMWVAGRTADPQMQLATGER